MASNKLTFKKLPFSRLIKESAKLAQLRREYASKSKKERKLAADFQYHDTIATQMFNKAMRIHEKPAPWPGEVIALAIDPLYAPAILTVGSYEYIYGRIDEAMDLFLSLCAIPENTEDISEIIDKAGDFLLDNQDYHHALTLYSTAVREFPHIAKYYNGYSYCLAKLGRNEEALKESRRMVELEPDNYMFLTDLGWTLVEAERLEEAKDVLEQAVKLAPPDYELARENLKETHRRIKNYNSKEDSK